MSVRDPGLLVKVSRTGSVELWRAVVEELRRRGLLQEVRHVGTALLRLTHCLIQRAYCSSMQVDGE